MAKIDSYPVFDFSGGIRRDKSFFDFKKNELLDARNIEIDEQGRVRTRLGSHQLGEQVISTSNVENSFYFQRIVGGAVPVPFFLVNTDTAGVIKNLTASHITGAITTASVSITLNSVTGFRNTGSDSAEIEGDLFSYTGITGSTLTGVTGLSESHAVGAAVHQWNQISATTVNGARGVSYAPLNNVVYIQAHDGGGYTWDGTNLTAVADGDEPNARFATTYHRRVWVAQFTSLSSARVYFSDVDDSTSWTASNFFNVEDHTGETITGFRVYNDNLLIYKTSSYYSYNEETLRKRDSFFGSYNNKTHQEIGGLVYNFCPAGVYVTNGSSVKIISEPVKAFVEGFRPLRDSGSNTIVTNTFSAQFENKYILWLGNVVNVDTSDASTPGGVALVYDTIAKSWTTYSGLLALSHIFNYNTFYYGGGIQILKGLFAARGSNLSTVFRLLSKRFIDANGTSRNDTTGDLPVDFYTNAAGTPVSSMIETQLYDLTHPELFKKFSRLRVYTEQGNWNFEYRIQDEKGIGTYRDLGKTKNKMDVLVFPPEVQGYKVGFRITAVNPKARSIFNGFVFEQTEVNSRK